MNFVFSKTHEKAATNKKLFELCYFDTKRQLQIL